MHTQHLPRFVISIGNYFISSEKLLPSLSHASFIATDLMQHNRVMSDWALTTNLCRVNWIRNFLSSAKCAACYVCVANWKEIGFVQWLVHQDILSMLSVATKLNLRDKRSWTTAEYLRTNNVTNGRTALRSWKIS